VHLSIFRQQISLFKHASLKIPLHLAVLPCLPAQRVALLAQTHDMYLGALIRLTDDDGLATGVATTEDQLQGRVK
jgi:hypothetical protein